MTIEMQSERDAQPYALPERVALLSIAGFWAFYFLIITIRAALVGFDGQLEMLGRRLIVVAVSGSITFLFYLILRRQVAISIRRSIVTAALLAIPASLIHSTVNEFAFREIQARAAAKWVEEKAVVIDEKNGAEKLASQDGQIGSDDQTKRELPPPPLAQVVPPPDAKNITIQVDYVDEQHEKSRLNGIFDYAVNSYFFFAAWAALYLALSYASETRRLERRTARLRAAAQSAELKALRYQINPHFLFNTLNSLSSLIMTAKPSEAEKMIMNLSAFFRASLTANPTEDITLEEEINLQRLYLDIEAVRFPSRLKIDISLPDELKSACVPVLILQPLVENAIKHGVSQAKEPVTVAIHAREDLHGLVLSVENSGYATGDESNGMGLGLQNVQDRLAARYGDKATCRWGALPDGGFGVTLYMPVVRDGC